MDTSENLKQILALCERVSRGEASEANVDRLVELVLALHDWIAGGGFLPQHWQGSREKVFRVTLQTMLKLDRQIVPAESASPEHERFRRGLDKVLEKP